MAHLLLLNDLYLIRAVFRRISFYLEDIKLMKNLTKVAFGVLISTALTGTALAQTATPTPVSSTETTTTKTTTTTMMPSPTPVTTTQTTTSTMKTDVVQNADGTYSVIEYPVGKEVTVEFTPTDTAMTAKGMARVMRTGNETMVNLDLNGLDNSNYFVYAVDPMGKVSYLGPVTGADGIAKTSFKTPLNQFMLVLSPTEGLTNIGNDTMVTFRSAVPKGYAVVNNTVTSPTGMEKQVAQTQAVSSIYEVPLLGVQSFSGKTTETRINFSGDLEGLKGKAYIKPRKDGTAQIKMRFDDLKLAPKQKRYVLWAVSADKAYTKIGQIINTGARQEGEIRGETALKDFGLFVTIEDADVLQPTSTMYSTFSVGR
jgi:hypothetical protein